jgi:hypothetical protein
MTVKLAGLFFNHLNAEAILQKSPKLIGYDKNYFENYKQRSQTEMGHKLHAFRKTYVECFCDPDDKIIDYGTGYGELVVNSNRWFGYDIMEETKQKLGTQFDDSVENYEAVCLFDVLEHICNPTNLLTRVKDKLFVTIPLFQNWNNLLSITSWRHWKPGEHLFYASPTGFEQFVNSSGFKTIDKNEIESSLGRLDIFTYYFRRNDVQS